jgi:uncharacterized SAM-binding protein YcdF (DUF218 family)
MYFILSKVLLFLLYPMVWIFVLFLTALIAKDRKRKQRLLLTAVVLLYLFSIPLFINAFANAWSVPRYNVKNKRVYSCAIILGGFSSPDANGNGYFNSSADRFIQGIKLLSTGKVKHLLVTGGSGSLIQKQFREGTWVKTQLDELKYPDSSILIESNSRNTIENAVFSKPILQKAHLQPPYLLVTSDFHMRRAQMIFKKQEYDFDTYPCNFSGAEAHINISDLVPDAGSFGGWNTYLKELVGYVVDYF